MTELRKEAIPALKKYKDIQETDTLGKALALLDNSNEILVVFNHKNKYVGILPQHSILRTDLDPEKSKIKNLKVSSPKVESTAEISEYVRLMLENNLMQLPVSSKDKIIGVISYDDILKEHILKNYGNYKVSQVMSEAAISVLPEEKLAKVYDKFRKHTLFSIPVIKNKKFMGMVQLNDTVDAITRGQKKAGFGKTVKKKTPILELPVRNIMTPPTATARESDLVSDIVNKMLSNDIDCISILDSDQNLKAVVTVRDLLKLIVLPQKAFRQINVQINSEIEDISRESIESQILSVIDKFSSMLRNSTVEVIIKEHKEKKRGQSLIYSRIHIHAGREHFDATAEGWGIEHSIGESLEKIEKQLRRKKPTKKDKTLKKRV